jgi:hypothetical protein
MGTSTEWGRARNGDMINIDNCPETRNGDMIIIDNCPTFHPDGQPD